MSALRLARAFTGRDKIVKCAGCYHGHADGLLVSAGSGALTFSVPDSAGVPASYAADTLVIPFNDDDALTAIFKRHPGQVAAVIVEPVAGNMGIVAPRPGYLQALRNLTASNGALLILDEVMTGFRLAYGGAQTLYGITPDLTCLGKVIGGGLPIGALGGRAEIMRRLAPEGDVYQAGTLSGNPIAVAAGIAQLRALSQAGTYEQLEEASAALERGLREVFTETDAGATLNRIGSMWTIFFTDQPVVDLASARRSDTQAFASFFHAMLERGVSLPPAQFEAAFVSLAHSPSEIDRTVEAAREALKTPAQSRRRTSPAARAVAAPAPGS